jgi:C-terminal peptidase prc
MPLNFSRILLPSLSFAFVLATLAPASAAPTAKEYWNETKLGIDNIKGAVSNKICYSNETAFVSCVASLRSLADSARTKSLILPVVGSEKIADCAKIENFGPMSWCQSKKTETSSKLKPSELIAQNRAEKQADNLAVKGTFQYIVTAVGSCRSPMRKEGAEACLRNVQAVDFDTATDTLWAEIMRTQPNARGLAAGQAINTFLSVFFDPHTYIIPSRLFEDTQKSSEQFVGIGAQVGSNGNRLLVINPIEGGAALAAGIKQGDIISAIDGQPVDLTDGNISSAVDRLRGKEGTPVKVEITRGKTVLSLTIVRKPVVMENVTSRVLSDRNRKIGYIRLNGFNPKSCEQIKGKIESLTRQNVAGLIFDLRANGGGLLDEAECIGGLFVGKKTIVQVQDLHNPDKLEPHVSKQEQVTTLPMVTLIDSVSASASEVVSGALQDHERSWIAGDRSFGKGSVQRILPIQAYMIRTEDFKELFNPAIVSIFIKDIRERFAEEKPLLQFADTYQRFFQPSGRTNQSVGIIPDFALDPFPGATADDKIAFREEDRYTNALPKIGAPWVQTRPAEVNSVENCMKATGQAEKLYEQKKNDAISPDYQLLKAQDILACVNAR